MVIDGLGDLDVGEVLGERFEGEWEGGGLFLGVSAFFWGVLSAAFSCRSCWTAPEIGVNGGGL